MESEIEITETATKGWFEKIKSWSYENWQTILVVLIVLIVGISAYNYNQQNNTNLYPAVAIDDNESNSNELDKNNQEDETEDNNTEETSPEIIAENEDQEEAAKEDSEAEPDEETKNEKTEEGFSSLDNSGKTYTITANDGEGITHLARRALEMYTQETSDGSNLTKEQKIYAEDYIQNRIGNEKINTGHQETFSESLIKDAISNANDLSEESLKNLTKYVK
ncbi:MAG: hypothetical protein KAQ64_02135 [Candidatus Pacebacteria bacterium]|nr:hypothetical protein [Candidatus Paceibacterota bacterium]